MMSGVKGNVGDCCCFKVQPQVKPQVFIADRCMAGGSLFDETVIGRIDTSSTRHITIGFIYRYFR